MIVREATPGDLDAIKDLQRRAFAASAHGHHGEAELVAELIDDGDDVLSLVSEDQGLLVGHALFSRMTVVAGGKGISAVGLGPVATDPGFRERGVAAELIDHGHALLAERGEVMAFVLGDPAYYTRFGYAPALAARFQCAYACDALMAMMLDSGRAPPKHGSAAYAPAFDRMDD